VTGSSTAKEADRQARTTITYSPDQDRAALLLARNLATRPQLVPVSGLGKLTLTVGADWSGVTLVPLPEEDFAGALPQPTTSAPTTSTKSGTTTTTEPPVTEAPSGGIIGKPPEGVTCS
jgi:hypothetical protein